MSRMASQQDRYPKKPERRAMVKKLAEEKGFVWLVTDRQLKAIGESAK